MLVLASSPAQQAIFEEMQDDASLDYRRAALTDAFVARDYDLAAQIARRCLQEFPGEDTEMITKLYYFAIAMTGTLTAQEADAAATAGGPLEKWPDFVSWLKKRLLEEGHRSPLLRRLDAAHFRSLPAMDAGSLGPQSASYQPR